MPFFKTVVVCPPAIKRAITRFGRAAQEYEVKGSYHPEEWDAIEEEYHASREALEELIARSLK